MKIVTCKKCKKSFDYDKYMGVCPKCCHYYSTTSYDDDLKYETNILETSTHDRCSYHGTHMDGINSGHSEDLHSNYDYNNYNDINKEKEEIARKLREKYANNPPSHSNYSKSTNYKKTYTSSYQEGTSTRPRNVDVNLRNANIRYDIKNQNKKSKNIVLIIFIIFFITQFALPLIFGFLAIFFEIVSSFF